MRPSEVDTQVRQAKAAAEACERALKRAEAGSVQAIVLERARGLIRKAAGLSLAEALRQVWKADPQLYQVYRRELRSVKRVGARPNPIGGAQ